MEYNTKIIGRKLEQNLLAEYCETAKSELIAIYGRRRVGKTYLVKQFFDNNFDFCFTGSFETPRITQLKLFKNELERYSHRKWQKPKDWDEAFNQLRDYLHRLGKRELLSFLTSCLGWILPNPDSYPLSAISGTVGLRPLMA